VLEDPAGRRIRRRGAPGRFDRVVVFHASRHPGRGRSVADIAAERGADGFDTFLDLIVEGTTTSSASSTTSRRKNIRALLQSPIAMVSSDGLVMPPPDRQDDPSLYWPVQLREYPGVLRALRARAGAAPGGAIRKMTSFPAQRFRLFDRGAAPRPQKPRRASTSTGCATARRTSAARVPSNIRTAPGGIDWVVVNGVPVLEDRRARGGCPAGAAASARYGAPPMRRSVPAARTYKRA
jgi:hypothetical protein